jgi:putrescine aminotransferase
MKWIGRIDKDRVFDRFAHHVSSGKAAFFKSVGIDFVCGRRQGPFMWDAGTGKRLINCHCNGGVFNLGHRHPEIVDALRDSLEELDIGNHHLVSEPRAQLAARLAALTPGDLRYTVFSVGGGEAVDLAIKAARGVTGKAVIVSATGGYHGHTGLALAAGDAQYRDPFGPNPPGFCQVPFGDIAALERTMDDRTAAVLLETVPATYGMPVPDPTYFPRVRRLCDRFGALLLIDEVQTGLGRTGRLWGIDHFDVTPDALIIGKGLSGGVFPMAATCFAPRVDAFFKDRPFVHISTFGGAEIGVPVALAVLEVVTRTGFLEQVRATAQQFSAGFQHLVERHPQILVGLRQLGLMMGIEMTDDRCGPVLSRTLYDNGVLSVYANNNPRVSQLLPPLVIDAALADEILQRVDRALTDAEAFMGG